MCIFVHDLLETALPIRQLFFSIDSARGVVLAVRRVMAGHCRWQVRFVRKRRVQTVEASTARVVKRFRKKNAHVVMQSERRPACAPAFGRQSRPCADAIRFAVQVVPPAEDVNKLAQRLRAGRTMQA